MKIHLINVFRRCLPLMFAVGIVAAASIAPAQDPASATPPAGVKLLTSSYLGGEGDGDEVVAAAIQSDGSIVLAANLERSTPLGDVMVGGNVGAGDPVGVVLRISGDGRRLLGMQHVSQEGGASVHDLALDGEDNIYVATGGAGLRKLDPTAQRVLWDKPLDGQDVRIDAAPDGTSAVLLGGKANRIVILSPDGEVLGETRGSALTQDVCIHGDTKTVIFTGFRNDHAFDGKRRYPVQIAYLKGVGYNGKEKWWDYGWSTDRDAPDFLNKPTNNMADTRGYRVAIGENGKLYAAFEAAGGNHILRYSPKNVNTKSDALVGGDQYHQFHNSKAEHKTIFGRFDPATGEAEKLIQLTGRLGDGRANAARVKDGALAADADGRVYLGGAAAYGLPMSWMPEGTGDYTGGSFLLMMSPDFQERELMTRLVTSGSTRAVAVRTVDGKRRLVIAGGPASAEKPLHTANALQPEPRGEDGYFAVLEIEPSPDAPSP